MKIVIIQHENDFKGEKGVYFIEVIARCWRDAGHEVVFINGLQKNITADVAILHVNLSLVPGVYVRYALQFPVALNFGVTDIRKRSISKYLVQPGDEYDGPVIVKTDLNCGGLPEAQIHNVSLPKRRSLMKYIRKSVRKTRNFGIKLNLIHADISRFVETEYRESFRVYDDKESVPSYIWDNEDWVVEQFLPEIEGNRFVIRNAHFLGTRMICFKNYSSDSIVKDEAAEGTSEIVEIDESVIHFRDKIGLHYGKIDYVIHQGSPVILDVAKTMGGAFGERAATFLAPGIKDYISEEKMYA